MEIEEFDQRKEIYTHIINIVDEYSDFDSNFISFKEYLEKQKIQEDVCKLKFTLTLITKIADNHHRYTDFFKRMEQVILFFSDTIREKLTSSEVFSIFKGNKKLILFLLRENLLTIDESMYNYYISLNSENCRLFLLPELTPFIETDKKLKKIKEKLLKTDPNIFDSFDEKRNLGENESKLCTIIREDLIDDFIVYINEHQTSLSCYIDSSIFESNPFLSDKQVKLIEYAAFFGSIQIFKYLLLNNVDLEPSIWIYAIHSDNAEIIQIIEEKKVTPPNDSFDDCFYESIKCHNINISDYLLDNLMKKGTKTDGSIIRNFMSVFLFNYNYYYLPTNILNFISNPSKVYLLSYFCSSLNKITIPTSITSIGANAFKQCVSLVEILIPSSVKSIGNGAFSECSALKSITIPSSVDSIAISLFNFCTSLEKVTLPPSVTNIQSFAFARCTSLSEFTFPESVKVVEENAFRGCSSLTKLTILSSKTKFKKNSFADCQSLAKIHAPESFKVEKLVIKPNKVEVIKI